MPPGHVMKEEGMGDTNTTQTPNGAPAPADQTTTNQTPASGTPANPGTPGQPTSTMSQEVIDAIVEQRLARERRQHEERLQALGFNTWDDVSKLVNDTRKKEQEELERSGQYKELADRIKAEKDAEIAKRDAELAKFRQQYQAKTVETTLLEAAGQHRAIAPNQVAALLRDRVRVNDEGNVYVAGPNGEPALDGKGNELPVSAFVKSFLDENPHFVQSAPGAGAQGRPAGTPPPIQQPWDASKANDLEYLQANATQILELAKAGKIRL
jgi:hypothetical protein